MKILDYKVANFWPQLKSACEPVAMSGDVGCIVSEIIASVRKEGDKALLDYTERFDGVALNKKNLKVSKAEIAQALKTVSKQDRAAINSAITNVKFFNSRTRPKDWKAKNPDGATVGEKFYPIKRVGLYIPGGQVPLVSTVVMTATLARIAACPEICVCTPPSKDGKINAHLLAALHMQGISEIYKVGGAQAVAAMGLGTESIPAVDKIFGPGNAFVIEAKRQLFGVVGCDLLPGPSEVLVLADSSAKPKFIAADLLSQAEHGSGKEKIFFVTSSKGLLQKTRSELEMQARNLSHSAKLLNIILSGTYAIIVPNLKAAAEVANFISAEHMELHVKPQDAQKLSEKITTAGAILVGENTPTVLGDFVAGPSHTLPTGRTGRFSSGLQVQDFMRRSSFVKYDAKSCKKALKTVSAFAKMESLDAHGKSLSIRL